MWWFVVGALAGPELCNGVDDDGDGAVDEGPVLVGDDLDGDGFADPSTGTLVANCSLAMTEPLATDCDDADRTRHPDADEMCNGVDDDCDGEVDEGGACGCDDAVLVGDEDVLQICLDADDWYGAATTCQDMGYHLVTTRDASEQANVYAAVAPYASDVWLGLHDLTVEGSWEWVNGSPLLYENWRSGEPNNSGKLGEDCAEMESSGLWDDEDCFVHQAFVCERNCTVESFYADVDGDGLGDPDAQFDACSAPDGAVRNALDCDDHDATYPAVWFVDGDADGVGGDDVAVGCPAVDWVTDGGDCDDADATVYPGAPDAPGDGIDADCDGSDASEPVDSGLPFDSAVDTGGGRVDSAALDTGLVDTGGAPATTDRPVASTADTGGFSTNDGTVRVGDEGEETTGPPPSEPDYGFGCRTAASPGGLWLGLLVFARRRSAAGR